MKSRLRLLAVLLAAVTLTAGCGGASKEMAASAPMAADMATEEAAAEEYYGEEKIETGLKKFGAMLGDRVEVGCNSVLNPGTGVGRNSNVYPLSCVRGVIPANSIYKTGGIIAAKK